jgi:glycosyltransferase involved in cell wall biosynthesis
MAAATARRRGGGMKVLMLLENNPYPQDVRVRQEAESLRAAGYGVTVLAPRSTGQARKETVSGVRVRRFWLPVSEGSAARFVLEYLVAHVRLLCGAVMGLIRGADVIHLHNPPDTLFPAALAARVAGRRVVFDHHDLFPELLAEKFDSAPLVGLARFAQRASFRAASAVLVTNESQAEALVADRGDDRAKVTVVRNGPPAASFERLPALRGGALSEPELLFLGELDSQDGVLMLADLLCEPGLEKARLTVVGDGALRAALAERVRQVGVEGRVSFAGFVAHERVPGLLASADICIDPAPCSELNKRSTMIKVTEYVAAARPIVAFDLRETRETAGDAALYAPCGDVAAFAAHVSRLALDPGLRARLSETAVKRRGGLFWERSEKALLRAYASIEA